MLKGNSVTNISHKDRAALAGELQSKGLISGEVGAFIAMPLSMNQDPNEKSNFLDVANRSLINAAGAGLGTDQIELRKKAISILENLKGLF